MYWNKKMNKIIFNKFKTIRQQKTILLMRKMSVSFMKNQRCLYLVSILLLRHHL